MGSIGLPGFAFVQVGPGTPTGSLTPSASAFTCESNVAVSVLAMLLLHAFAD